MRKTALKQKQEINHLTTNTKEENHTNTILALTTKITGTNNHWYLISLDIDVSNSPTNKQAKNFFFKIPEKYDIALLCFFLLFMIRKNF